MTKFKLNPGWTKEKMLAQFKARNNGTRALDAGGECAYRAPDGNTCALGAFIPDNIYHPKFEGLNATRLLDPREGWHCPDLLEVMPLPLKGMLRLQKVHDNCKGDTHAAVEHFLGKWVE